MTDKEKEDFLNPDDFDDDSNDSTDGNDDNLDTSDDDSTSTEDDENAKTQSNEDEDKKRNKQKDASYAAKRREKERKEREEREARIKEDAKIEGKLELLKENPFTNEKIVDSEDLRIYEIQKQLDDEGLDPISDLPKRLAEIARKEKEKQANLEKEKEKLNQEFKKDIEDFKKAYPDVDLTKLAKDEEYFEFAKNKLGRWTTAEIYEAYQQKKEQNSAKDRKAMIDKNADDVAKKVTKTPSTNTSTSNLPPKSVENMSKEEFKEYWRNKYGE